MEQHSLLCWMIRNYCCCCLIFPPLCDDFSPLQLCGYYDMQLFGTLFFAPRVPCSSGINRCVASPVIMLLFRSSKLIGLQ
jgi:hypothetical protein